MGQVKSDNTCVLLQVMSVERPDKREHLENMWERETGRRTRTCTWAETPKREINGKVIGR